MFYTQTLTPAKPLWRNAALILLASFLICLSGRLSLPLWFTPVPLVLQNTTVLLIAALLGSRRGTAATLTFLLQGAIGLPVFALGQAGLPILLGPRGGYLIGYLIASFITGYFAEKNKPTTAFLLGNLTIYFCGAGYLSTFVGLDKALLLGVAPFLLGDLLKALAALKFVQWQKR